MSDNIYDYMLEAQKHMKMPACRVAYTLNNTQPVACTIIGEQPLFYMDYEENLEEELLENEFDASIFSAEEEFFNEDDLDILKEEILSLKTQLNKIEKLSSDFIETDEQRIEKLFANVTSYTSQNEIENTKPIENYLKILSQSRLANSYISFAKDNNVTFAWNNQIDKSEYNRDNKKILINPNQNEADIILELSAELRRLWQHKQGALINPLKFHPDQAILINRAQIADINVSTVRIAWELQLAKYKKAWEQIENSPLSDLARAFAREAYLDFRTINNGDAAASVFESWFLSERCRAQDKALIQLMLNDEKGYVFNLGEMSKTITPDLIAALGTMPYGKNYLAAHVETIMTDPIFNEVRDRSNANFLWFIKFERTFKETEQELQTQGNKIAQDDHLSAQKSKYLSNGNNHNEQSGQLISFPGHEASTKTATKTGETGKRLSKTTKQQQPSADIIYLRAWSRD